MHSEGRREFIGMIFGITDKGVDGTLGENICGLIGRSEERRVGKEGRL